MMTEKVDRGSGVALRHNGEVPTKVLGEAESREEGARDWKKSMHGWTAFHLELVRSLLIPETGRGRDVQIHESPVMLEVKILLET
jgi:hypothetical protein